jgi:hypothetical protein
LYRFQVFSRFLHGQEREQIIQLLAGVILAAAAGIQVFLLGAETYLTRAAVSEEPAPVLPTPVTIDVFFRKGCAEHLRPEVRHLSPFHVIVGLRGPVRWAGTAINPAIR